MVQTRGYSKHINASRTVLECGQHVYLEALSAKLFCYYRAYGLSSSVEIKLLIEKNMFVSR